MGTLRIGALAFYSAPFIYFSRLSAVCSMRKGVTSGGESATALSRSYSDGVSFSQFGFGWRTKTLSRVWRRRLSSGSRDDGEARPPPGPGRGLARAGRRLRPGRAGGSRVHPGSARAQSATGVPGPAAWERFPPARRASAQRTGGTLLLSPGAEQRGAERRPELGFILDPPWFWRWKARTRLVGEGALAAPRRLCAASAAWPMCHLSVWWARWCGRQNTVSRDVPELIPRTCDYLRLPGKDELSRRWNG